MTSPPRTTEPITEIPARAGWEPMEAYERQIGSWWARVVRIPSVTTPWKWRVMKFRSDDGHGGAAATFEQAAAAAEAEIARCVDCEQPRCRARGCAAPVVKQGYLCARHYRSR